MFSVHVWPSCWFYDLLGGRDHAFIKPQHLEWDSLRLVLQSTESHWMQLKQKEGFVLKSPRVGVQLRLGRPGTGSHNYSYFSSSSLTPLTVSLHSTEKLAARIRLAKDPTCPALQAGASITLRIDHHFLAWVFLVIQSVNEGWSRQAGVLTHSSLGTTWGVSWEMCTAGLPAEFIMLLSVTYSDWKVRVSVICCCKELVHCSFSKPSN